MTKFKSSAACYSHATLQKYERQNTWFLKAQLKETSIWITKYVFAFFPNFKENTAIFPNSKGPGPQSQKGVREPW